MATSSAINNEPVASGAKVDMKFEVIVIPVADVDRSKAFYSKLGWRLDADFSFDNGFRVVQFTPPGSGCSVLIHRFQFLRELRRGQIIIQRFHLLALARGDSALPM